MFDLMVDGAEHCLTKLRYSSTSGCVERMNRTIVAKGIYRDPVRSSNNHFVKASGLCWLGLMLLAPTPWSERV